MSLKKYKVQVNVIVHEVYEFEAPGDKEAKEIAISLAEDMEEPISISEKILGIKILDQ